MHALHTGRNLPNWNSINKMQLVLCIKLIRLVYATVHIKESREEGKTTFILVPPWPHDHCIFKIDYLVGSSEMNYGKISVFFATFCFSVGIVNTSTYVFLKYIYVLLKRTFHIKHLFDLHVISIIMRPPTLLQPRENILVQLKTLSNLNFQ